MCGVVGWISPSAETCINSDVLEAMTRTLIHRGPDGEGYFCDGRVGLGHRRLSIIDIEGGNQPLSDGSVTISYNGEIYNFKILRDELTALGYVFSTQCDSEVLVHGWKAWKEDLVHKLRGMFAFIIYDAEASRVFVARDRLGIKPLHWTKTHDGHVLFASEIKALLAHPSVSKKLNAEAIEDFLSLGYVADPKTIFNGISKLPPGHYASISLDSSSDTELTPVCYWQLTNYLGENDEDEGTLDAFKDKLQDAVNARMISDVPLGGFLSGGIDSSVITALMQRNSQEPIKTFSIGFDLYQYDESYFAGKVAASLGFDHLNTNVSVSDLTLIDKLVEIYDEPFADNSAIPTYILSKVTSEHVKVVLSGDGADELLYGYRNYKMIWMENIVRRVLPESWRRIFFGGLAKCYPRFNNAPKMFRAKTTLEALAGSAVKSYHNAISITPQYVLKRIYSSKFRAMLNGYTSLSMFEKIVEKVKFKDPLKTIQLIDFKTYLPGGILTKVDRASMKNSLEVRVPFLDHHLVQWSLGLRPSVNLSVRKVKRLLIDACASVVPDFVLKREKMGFSAPIDEWLRQIPARNIESRLLNKNLQETGLFNIEDIQQLIQEHHARKYDHGMTLWSLLVLNAFLEKHFKVEN